MCSLEKCSLRTLCGNERLLIWQTSCFFLRLGLLTHDLLSLSPFLFTSSWELLPEKTFLQIFSVFSSILITFRSLNSAVLAWKDGVRGEGLFCPPGTLAMSGDIFLPHCCGIKISRYQQKPRKLLSISDVGTAEMRPATLRAVTRLRNPLPGSGCRACCCPLFPWALCFLGNAALLVPEAGKSPAAGERGPWEVLEVTLAVASGPSEPFTAQSLFPLTEGPSLLHSWRAVVLSP